MDFWLVGHVRVNWRTLISVMTLGALLACVLPVPYGRPSHLDKDASSPFPCQNRPCGCRSAEQCWKKCCCFTHAQKLAWAEQHGIVAPQLVREAAAQEQNVATNFKATARETPSASSQETGLRTAIRSCCLNSSRPCVASNHDEADSAIPVPANTSESTEAMSRGEAIPRLTKRKTTSCNVVIGVSAQSCQGVGWSWATASWNVVAPSKIALSQINSPRTRFTIHSDHCKNRPPEPPVPPPKICIASNLGDL